MVVQREEYANRDGQDEQDKEKIYSFSHLFIESMSK
jgi:hypothetical protein